MISAREDQLPQVDPTIVEAKLRYANSTIPFVSAVVQEIDQLAREHVSIRTRLGEIDLHRHLGADGDMYSEELQAVEESADQLCDRLEDCYKELGQIGGISFDASEPTHVDFLLTTDEGAIHLCWKLGEQVVSHWHWSNELCDARKPIVGFEELTTATKPMLT
jgi:hypothetical protein